MRPENLEVKSVLFVPHTPGSELANRLRKEEGRVSSITGYSVEVKTNGLRTVKPAREVAASPSAEMARRGGVNEQ